MRWCAVTQRPLLPEIDQSLSHTYPKQCLLTVSPSISLAVHLLLSSPFLCSPFLCSPISAVQFLQSIPLQSISLQFILIATPCPGAMDEYQHSEPRYEAHPAAQINGQLAKINEKARLLRTIGMTRGDRALLSHDRLNFIWGEHATSKGASTTTWRKDRARRIYTEVQNANDHLFLSVILSITPTECAQGSFDDVVESLVRLENYEPYHLSLNPRTKTFFESVAAEQGFSRSRGYLSFMQTLFLQSLCAESSTHNVTLTLNRRRTQA